MFSPIQPRIKLALSVGLALCLLGVFSQPALADGIVIPDPPQGPDPVALEDSWLTIRYHRVSVLIEGQIAVTRVEQEFLNQYDWEVEGTYIFPMPAGASISKFVIWVDGVPVEGKILPAEEARQIYENIVRERRDPALLEYVGTGAVQARIYPIPPGGSRKIELEYSQVLETDNGLISYVYPLNTEKFSARPLEDCSVRVEINSAQPLRNVYSPTHQDRIYIQRDGDRRVVLGYEERDVLPDQDFELIYSVSEEDLGLQLLTYPDLAGESGFNQEGYFLLLAAPSVEVDQIIPRDIVLVLDTSGSMEGEKLIQAKEASRYVLTHLNQEDRFNVVVFSTGVKHFAHDLQPISNASQALSWIGGMQALGGTNINQALLEAIAVRTPVESGESGRPLVILFLTDGLPTEGVTDVQQILANVGASDSEDLRLFAFGVGDDVNTELLDVLAEGNRGLVSYVRPGERIDEEVSGLFAKIKTPVLTDLEIDFGEILVDEIYPPVLPDLFAGTQLIITGRYRLPGIGAGISEIQLSGSVNSQKKTYSFPVDFSTADEPLGSNSFIPRLWASRKIGYLLNQIRYQGENTEWVDAIIQLSIRYGIITPYTSFLIDEDDIFSGEGRDEAARDLMEEYEMPSVGAEAVDKADAASNLRAAESVGQPGITEHEPGGVVNQPVLVYVGDKTFFLQNGIWIDSTFDPDSMKTTPIGFGSDVYYELLTSRTAWGKYFALGKQVIFVDSGEAFEVVVGEGGLSSVPPRLSQPDTSSIATESDQPRRFPDFRALCSSPLLLGLVLVGLGGKIRN
ncbi:MAG: VWA domain-containing protein [Anaerolineales bacterium]|nr:MAG: VWA domain-containing protein [Anaerolineales bacterium]